ncbi:MAG: hypothetical protein V3U87_10880 [Methylococcaceae bacterium]
MHNKDLIKINKRLDDIENRIYLIFDELQRRAPDDKCSFAMYASTLFTAQQVKEVNILLAGACCDKVNGNFNVVEFRKKFEEFRQRHLPHSEIFSLRLIAEGFLVEERAIDICSLILKDINKNPEKEPWEK